MCEVYWQVVCMNRNKVNIHLHYLFSGVNVLQFFLLLLERKFSLLNMFLGPLGCVRELNTRNVATESNLSGFIIATAVSRILFLNFIFTFPRNASKRGCQ